MISSSSSFSTTSTVYQYGLSGWAISIHTGHDSLTKGQDTCTLQLSFWRPCHWYTGRSYAKVRLADRNLRTIHVYMACGIHPVLVHVRNLFGRSFVTIDIAGQRAWRTLLISEYWTKHRSRYLKPRDRCR